MVAQVGQPKRPLVAQRDTEQPATHRRTLDALDHVLVDPDGHELGECAFPVPQHRMAP